MRGGTRSNGYTIVEVLLFVVISGFMFSVAAVFINGRQGNAEFKQGTNAMVAQLNKVVNDVSNGVYPSTENFSCAANPSGGQPTFTNTPAGTAQGTNSTCVFMGKAILFNFGPAADSAGVSTKYDLRTIAGRRIAPGTVSNTPANLTEAQPVFANKLNERKTYEWGLKLISATQTSGATVKSIQGIGFIGSFGSYDASTAALNSGGQGTLILPLSTGPSGGPVPSAISEIKDSNVNQRPDIILCFDGGRGNFATIEFGGDASLSGTSGSQRLASKLRVYESAAALPPTCAVGVTP